MKENGLVLPNGNGRLITQNGAGKLHLSPRFEVASLLTAEAFSLPIRRLDPQFDAYEVDVRKLLNYQPKWREGIAEVASAAPVKIIRGGSVESSMAPQGLDTIYQPTNTTTINEQLPWVTEYFRGPFQLLVQRAFRDGTLVLGEGNATLNINYFKQEDMVGKQEISYEMHWDRNPVTALLFLTTMDKKEGGRLVLRQGRDGNNQATGRSLTVHPEAGKLIIFGGNRHPHEVTVVTSNQARMVVPGDYFSARMPEVHDPIHDKLVGVDK